MKIATAFLKSDGYYSQSRPASPEEFPAKPGENDEAYEIRTWRRRLHLTADGNIFIPATQFNHAVKEAGGRLRMRIPGKGQSEYGKCFKTGVMVQDNLVLPLKGADIPYDRLYVPSAPGSNKGNRVYKNFGRIDSWEGEVKFYILDDQLTEEVFTKALRHAGLLVGVGRFRPANGGFYGRFGVESVQWVDCEDMGMSEAAE